MTDFKLIVHRQRRILISIILGATILPFLLIAIVKLGHISPYNWFLGIIAFCLFIYGLIYFTTGTLIIRAENDLLEFSFQKKLAFNFKPIGPINISEIESFVTENKPLQKWHILNRIIVSSKSIQIGSGRIKKDDTVAFVEYISESHDIQTVNIWDLWQQKGWLRIAYIINSTILVFGLVICIIYIFTKGLDSKLLLFMIFPFSQLILYQFILKERKKN